MHGLGAAGRDGDGFQRHHGGGLVSQVVELHEHGALGGHGHEGGDDEGRDVGGGLGHGVYSYVEGAAVALMERTVGPPFLNCILLSTSCAAVRWSASGAMECVRCRANGIGTMAGANHK